MPIVAAVDAILGGKDARTIVAALLARPLKAERDAGA
jgi:glycerol-3-phosphate dehydrogenase (NAD(P)+)